ncbi:MAG: hypothetical protein Q7R84_00905 [bacterium]|nr:hypothetical protein [bacterium]
MKMLYISGPQSLDIKPEGLSRSIGVKFAVGKKIIVYGDDMLLSMTPFAKQGAFLMCPSNAQEEVKKLVKENRGFVSGKRSTEAVAEFLTKIYPKWHDKHRLIHSIYFDKDGVIWEAERIEQNIPFFKVINDYIRNCQGPYTAHPPISIATGATWESTLKALKHIRLNKENIPASMPWPPIIFEEGCLAFSPTTESTFDLTEEKYGLFSRDFREIIGLIVELGEEINKRVPEINKQLGLDCKIVHKERSGYTLDLPFGARGSKEELKKAHSLIYRNIRDLLGKDMEFAGLFTKQELEGVEN